MSLPRQIDRQRTAYLALTGRLIECEYLDASVEFRTMSSRSPPFRTPLAFEPAESVVLVPVAGRGAPLARLDLATKTR